MAETQGKVITCKAAVVWGPKEPLVIQEICVDPPQKMEVRVKILYSSICHTDLGAWTGVYNRIVESVGEGVKDVKEGDYVIPTFNGECGECRVCTNGVSNLCERYKVDPMKRLMVNVGGTRFSTTTNKDGGSSQKQRVYHFLNTSTFTEYTVLDSACVVKIDPNAPLKQMSLLSCGVSTDNPKLQSSSSRPPLPALSPSSLPQVVKLEPFITNELPFEKINDAFQLLRDGKSLRCVLQISKFLKK
ncbi:hypothetical protein DY000_02048789 [Brassica cretica]|uniref:Alcohol dehydrogenase-like N-terminal domain-containing protein n=1 Tax=Brassica cretica TaxID=69181 RepID=A0ABQ7ETS0_BRACR|nr:hypothetical protein DY000_02048789 [Brassica cretica]